MAFDFILAVVLGMITLGVYLGWRAHRKNVAAGKTQDIGHIFKRVVIGLLTATVLTLAWSSWVQVDTKNIGVMTSFGRPTQPLDNGPHAVWPWQVKNELDGAIQTDSYAGQDDTPCVTVRIARQATACVDMSVKWQLVKDEATTVFQDYRAFSNVRDSLVRRELGATGNEVFAGYDPLKFDDDGVSLAPSNDALSKQATTVLQRKAGAKIKVESVVVNYVKLDDATQQKLNEHNAETAKTNIAIQAQKTAKEQAKANAELAASLSKDPNVLTARCFDLYELAINKGQQVPMAGMAGCWNTPGNALALVGSGNNKPS